MNFVWITTCNRLWEFDNKTFSYANPSPGTYLVIVIYVYVTVSALIGPCFLKSYTDSELLITRFAGEDVTFDCGSVTADGRIYQLNYAWEFYKQGASGPSSSSSAANTASANRLTRRSNAGGNLSMMPTSGGPGKPSGSGTDVARFSDSQLSLRKVTLNNMGEYRCTVTNPSPDGSVAIVPKIERTFQLRVIRKFSSFRRRGGCFGSPVIRCFVCRKDMSVIYEARGGKRMKRGTWLKTLEMTRTNDFAFSGGS